MKNILIFNDISGLGNCSMSANLPIFTKLKHYCMPVVTGCYSCQTGFSNFSAVQNSQTVDFAKRIVANVKPNAFYVGFCGDVATLRGAIEVVNSVLTPDVYLFVDTIMGDNGKLYPVFDKEYVTVMKRLARLAQCISPNMTEACLLADVDYNALTSHSGEKNYLTICGEVFADFLSKVGCKSAVITGINLGEHVGNIVLEGEIVQFVTNERTAIDFSGTGDVFSSVLLGKLLNGESLFNATEIAANFVGNSAKNTKRTDRRFGVDFCSALDELK